MSATQCSSCAVRDQVMGTDAIARCILDFMPSEGLLNCVRYNRRWFDMSIKHIWSGTHLSNPPSIHILLNSRNSPRFQLYQNCVRYLEYGCCNAPTSKKCRGDRPYNGGLMTELDEDQWSTIMPTNLGRVTIMTCSLSWPEVEAIVLRLAATRPDVTAIHLQRDNNKDRSWNDKLDDFDVARPEFKDLFSPFRLISEMTVACRWQGEPWNIGSLSDLQYLKTLRIASTTDEVFDTPDISHPLKALQALELQTAIRGVPPVLAITPNLTTLDLYELPESGGGSDLPAVVSKLSQLQNLSINFRSDQQNIMDQSFCEDSDYDDGSQYYSELEWTKQTSCIIAVASSSTLRFLEIGLSNDGYATKLDKGLCRIAETHPALEVLNIGTISTDRDQSIRTSPETIYIVLNNCRSLHTLGVTTYVAIGPILERSRRDTTTFANLRKLQVRLLIWSSERMQLYFEGRERDSMRKTDTERRLLRKSATGWLKSAFPSLACIISDNITFERELHESWDQCDLGEMVGELGIVMHDDRGYVDDDTCSDRSLSTPV